MTGIRFRRGAVLGISADYHDAAAALVVDGRIVAAASEERFTGIKHDPSLPRNAIAWCLADAGIEPDGLAAVVFYGKPLLTYERILANQGRVGPRAIRSLGAAVAVWSRSKLWVPLRVERLLREIGMAMPPILFSEHHLSHAASAFYPSPFEHAATLTFDSVGEWATSTIGVGIGNRLELLEELRYPDSIGLLYSTITAQCGFAVNDGEYKLMGLAPFGEPRYVDVINEHVAHVGVDGSVRLNARYFGFRHGDRMGNRRLDELLGGPPRDPGVPPGQREADLARSAQVVLEDIVLRAARHAREVTGATRACLAGGVALNCVANERLIEEGPFTDIWIQPAAGDDGGAIGAALWAWHEVAGNGRSPIDEADAMSSCLLGPRFEHERIARWLADEGIPHVEHPDEASLTTAVAEALEAGAIVGWFQGRMEFGPRALGNRSILADPRDPLMVRRINELVKQREGFRPFAPSVLAEHADAWFESVADHRYMLVTSKVHRSQLRQVDADDAAAATDFGAQLALRRSTIPAVTHVDGSARVQVVHRTDNPRFHALLGEFHARTGCPVLLNTSFNGRDQPIVLTPSTALACFASTGLDLLVLERCVVRRADLDEHEAVA